MAMAMEFVSEGDMHGLLHDKSKVLDWGIKLRIAVDIARGFI